MHPQALYQTCSNGHNFIAKVDSGASHNCISKSLSNRIGYSSSGQQTGNSSLVHKVGNAADVQCLLCGLKGHKVATCRKLPRAQELIKQDKQQYWSKRKGYTKRSANNNAKSQQINEIDDATVINEVENQEEGVYDQDYNEMNDISFPTSDLTEEEDQVYYYDD